MVVVVVVVVAVGCNSQPPKSWRQQSATKKLAATICHQKACGSNRPAGDSKYDHHVLSSVADVLWQAPWHSRDISSNVLSSVADVSLQRLSKPPALVITECGNPFGCVDWAVSLIFRCSLCEQVGQIGHNKLCYYLLHVKQCRRCFVTALVQVTHGRHGTVGSSVRMC